MDDVLLVLHMRRILHAVGRLDDKPHQLFSSIRLALDDLGLELGLDDGDIAEGIRLCDLGYVNAYKINKEIA